jgi:hypothetical protein
MDSSKLNNFPTNRMSFLHILVLQKTGLFYIQRSCRTILTLSIFFTKPTTGGLFTDISSRTLAYGIDIPHWEDISQAHQGRKKQYLHFYYKQSHFQCNTAANHVPFKLVYVLDMRFSQ